MSKLLISLTLALFIATLAYESDAALFFHAKPQAYLKPPLVSLLIFIMLMLPMIYLSYLGTKSSSR